VVHLGLKQYARTAQRIYDEGSDYIISAKLRLVRERPRYTTLFTSLHIATEKRFTRLPFSNRFIFESVVIGLDLGDLFRRLIKLVVVCVNYPFFVGHGITGSNHLIVDANSKRIRQRWNGRH